MLARRLSNAVFLLVLGVVLGCNNKPKDAATEGRELFASACARCHGADGTGGVPVVNGGPAPRNFHDHAFQLSRTDEQLKLTIVNGKGTGMPGFARTFDDAQLAALVAYVRGFDTETRK
jgi:mono/diheme cytochrome c family protein